MGTYEELVKIAKALERIAAALESKRSWAISSKLEGEDLEEW